MGDLTTQEKAHNGKVKSIGVCRSDACAHYEGRIGEESMAILRDQQTGVEAKRNGEVWDAYDAMDKELEDLDVSIQKLVSRLDPVMAQEPPTENMKATAAEPPRGELARMLRTRAYRIECATCVLTSVLSRLEV